MFKDYYKILGISRQASFQDIKSAYRAMSIKWHPDKNPNSDVTSIIQDINEAYAILKDEEKRERYNKEYDVFFGQISISSFEQSASSTKGYEYDYNVQDDTLREDIAYARQYAKDLVDEFFKSFKEASKAAIKGAAKSSFQYVVAWIISGFVLVILSAIIRGCYS